MYETQKCTRVLSEVALKSVHMHAIALTFFLHLAIDLYSCMIGTRCSLYLCVY